MTTEMMMLVSLLSDYDHCNDGVGVPVVRLYECCNDCVGVLAVRLYDCCNDTCVTVDHLVM